MMFSYLTIKVVEHGSALFEVGDVKKFTVLETEEDNTDRQRHFAVRHLPCVCQNLQNEKGRNEPWKLLALYPLLSAFPPRDEKPETTQTK